MSYLERLQAKAAMKAVEEPAKGSKGAFAPFEGDPTAHIPDLPADCSVGLDRLQSMRCPQGLDPLAFKVAVLAALGIARDGWAAKALALGWSPLELYGVVVDPAGDPHSDGLAVWLAGRKVLALDEKLAVVREGEGWAYYNRREQVGARLLWELAQ